MNETIHKLGNGDFETSSFREKVTAVTVTKQKCKCTVPEPRSKCSENGISAYCGKCAKEIK